MRLQNSSILRVGEKLNHNTYTQCLKNVLLVKRWFTRLLKLLSQLGLEIIILCSKSFLFLNNLYIVISYLIESVINKKKNNTTLCKNYSFPFFSEISCFYVIHLFDQIMKKKINFFIKFENKYIYSHLHWFIYPNFNRLARPILHISALKFGPNNTHLTRPRLTAKLVNDIYIFKVNFQNKKFNR